MQDRSEGTEPLRPLTQERGTEGGRREAGKERKGEERGREGRRAGGRYRTTANQ